MKILITAGPTREYIDPVRFITNASTGRMGYALAESAQKAGHEVTVLSGPVALAPPAGCRMRQFVTVQELGELLAESFPQCDALAMAAAVGDFAVAGCAERKLPRSDGPITLSLLPTEDMLAAVGRAKRHGQIIVAFALEQGAREDVEARARRKLRAKNADFIVLNSPSAMGAEASEACVLSPDGCVLPWSRRSKEALAGKIVNLLAGQGVKESH